MHSLRVCHLCDEDLAWHKVVNATDIHDHIGLANANQRANAGTLSECLACALQLIGSHHTGIGLAVHRLRSSCSVVMLCECRLCGVL